LILEFLLFKEPLDGLTGEPRDERIEELLLLEVELAAMGED
jgi:hypothetical protein